MSLRRLKETVRALLRADAFEAGLEALAAMPERRVINPLFGLLYDGDTLTRWRAVSAMGRVTARLAEREPESARVIMRRLMWNLNDESGGIGWGSPEAMGEIMACHFGLAQEYAAILISFLDPRGNYLEHEVLQRGVLWGVGRLARVRPHLAESAGPLVGAFFDALDPELRGLGLWAALPLPGARGQERIAALHRDSAEIDIYEDGRLNRYSIARLAEMAAGLPRH